MPITTGNDFIRFNDGTVQTSAARDSFVYGQRWHDVTGGRGWNATYQNNTGHSMFIRINAQTYGNSSFLVRGGWGDGWTTLSSYGATYPGDGGTGYTYINDTCVIPPGGLYMIQQGGAGGGAWVHRWLEMRV